MRPYHILIYGGGNCEIAPFLQESLKKLLTLQGERVRIAAKVSIFANSCIAMYRRLQEDMAITETQGGTYFYAIDGKERIETIEMHMTPASDKEAFRAFLEAEIGKEAGEYLLILVGQGTKEGVLLDFVTPHPTYMTYAHLGEIIGEVCAQKNQAIHLIVDMPTWHGFESFYQLTQCGWIHGLFFYERPQKTALFPIEAWLTKCLKEDIHWLMQAVLNYPGYQIHTHLGFWRLCAKKWQRYKQMPGLQTWREFYDIYSQLVISTASMKQLYERLDDQRKILDTKEYLTKQEIKTYFDENYGWKISYETLNAWMSELKTCIDYYKI
jgi:hypothetical protein